MRKALNENPAVQFGLLGVLALVVVAMMLLRGGGGAEPEAAPSDPALAGAPVPVAASGTAAVPAPATASAVPVSTSAPFEPGKGLPKDVVSAYESGDVVVLLVVQDNGIEDKALEREVEALKGRPDTAVFITDAKKVGDYSRIAQGVALNRVPAIIALKPLDPKAKGQVAGLPQASITYGYMGPDGVEQVLGDARYKGKTFGYDPR